MRILHTADWHLGSTWDGQSRRADQERVLDEILALCDERNVDLLLVAGDILHDRVEGGHPEAAVRRLLLRLEPHLDRGRAVFLLRGNHDPLELFRLMSLLIPEVAGSESWPLVVADLPGIHQIPGHDLQVIALPYLSPRMLQQRAAEIGVTAETMVAGAAGIIAQQIESLYAQVQTEHPAIFAGHVLLGGAQLTPDIEAEANYSREVWLVPSRLPHFTSYNALGHIHLIQEVRGAAKPTWYSGAPDRLNLGERDYTPQVLLVETPDSPGGTATVQPIPLTTPTRFVRAELRGMPEVEDFCAHRASGNPLGVIRVVDIAAGMHSAVEAQIHAAAPRLRIEWPAEVSRPGGPTPEGPDHRDVHGTVIDYLGRSYADEQHRHPLIQAFETLWAEGSEEARS